MPFFSIETNKKFVTGDFSSKIKETSEFVAGLLGKPEKWVMVSMRHSATMMFSGDGKHTAFVELKSIGLVKEQCKNYSKAICEFVHQEFGIPADRIFIEFQPLEKEMFGWNSDVF